MFSEKKSISIVVPVFNEEQMVHLFLATINDILASLHETYEIIFVNDGSKDKTLESLINLKKEYGYIRIVNLSRNFGKEAAMTAGLDVALGDAIIPMDVDLQDPPELIKEFIKKWKEGYEVVLAKRVDRTTDSLTKRVSAGLFYKFHNKVAHVPIPENVGDYRLITKKVLQAIKLMPENQRFMKGIFSWVGFNSTTIEYKRETRQAGNSSFNGWKLWNLAVEGITSFSTVPLRIWLYIGLFIAFLSFCFGVWIVLKTLLFGIDWPGYASLITITLFLGGIQLIGIGVLGEYVGRIYMESKHRPIYIIENEF